MRTVSIQNVNQPTTKRKGETQRVETLIKYQWSEKPLQGTMFIQENALLFILQGSACIRYGTSGNRLHANQMAFLRKDRLYDFNTDNNYQTDGTNFEYLILFLQPELIKEFVKLSDLSTTHNGLNEILRAGNIDATVYSCLSSMRPLFKDHSCQGSLLKIKILELLFYVASSEPEILEQILDLREQFRTNITTVIDENIMNSLSLNELAGLSGRSLSSFRRDFLAIYNTSPSRWIRQKRLEKARELLRSTTMTITDICYTLGFESIAHFSRLFKSYFRFSPSEYRLQSSLSSKSKKEAESSH